MQRAAHGGVVADFRIPEHRGDLKPGRADLPQQRERQAPFLLEPQARGNPRAFARLGRQPLLGHGQRRAQHPGAHAGPQRHGHRDLAVGDVAQRAVLPRHGDRASALLGKTRPVENDDTREFGNRRPELPPEAIGVPRRMGDEVLELLIRARSVTRSRIALIDLRRLSLSSLRSYRRNAPRCATCVKHTSNGSSQVLKRSSHTGALRGSRDSTAPQRIESGQKYNVLKM
jgi:hypothetical protein